MRNRVFRDRREKELHDQYVVLLKQRRDEMVEEADAACGKIYDENIERRREGSPRDRLRHLPRVEPGQVGVSIKWRRIESVYSKKAGRYMPRYVDLPLGGRTRMTRNDFKGVTQEEWNLIHEIEAKVEDLRRETAWANKLKRQLDAHPYRRRRQAVARSVAPQQADTPEEEFCEQDYM